MLRWLIVAALIATSGCQSSLRSLPDDLPERVELEQVPFFPQAEYQCGPAALATVLENAGVATTPDALVPMVYLPARKGSLQTELVAATRRFDRIPYPLPADVRALMTQVRAGRPVLVLQNLGLKHWPQWHFAVVVGFDRASDEVILRSGTERRALMSVSRFVRTWDRGGRWAIAVLQPRELPADPDPERFLTAAAGLEATGRLDAAEAAYETARAAWPESAWPLLGLANIAYLRERFATAQSLYRQVIERDPSNLSARYNLADTLAERGCPDAARSELQTALTLAADTAMRARLQARLDELPAANDHDHAACGCAASSC
ncbi:MAG TPA: PA2778 family cysteine peptidase [Steroidobacteraceae bacterium]|nr:PA2778 family cysteine peptidase [Steroidobacteraceae bacterium]